MEASYTNLRRGDIQSVSGSVDHAYEQLTLSVLPTAKPQTQSLTAVKVILGLVVVVVLAALGVAVLAIFLNQQQISELRETIHGLEQKVDELSSPTEASTSISPATTLMPGNTSPPTSCYDIHSSHPSTPSGVYTIHIGGRVQGREVWCDMVTDGGGWTRFQRRQDGTELFNRTWEEYRKGFGSAGAEFWLGNADLHQLTVAQPSQLRVDLWDWDGGHGYAKYSTFSVGSASTNYTLRVAGYSGTIGDSLTGHHNSRQFTTTDRDNDRSSYNCAASNGGGGGWWYDNCDYANLNGRYIPGGVNDLHGVEWYYWRDSEYSYRAAAMMVRPIN